MVEIGILYDSVRLEEKMLFREAGSAGVQAKPIDARTLRLSTDASSLGKELPSDIYLQRCLSYFRSLHITKAIESYGFKIISSFDTISTCGDNSIQL